MNKLVNKQGIPFPLNPKDIADIVNAIDSGLITHHQAKTILMPALIKQRLIERTISIAL